MKHKTHRIVSLNLSILLAVALFCLHKFDDIVEICIYTILTAKLTWYFSTLPDFIEGNERKKHRTWAHSLISFMLILLAILIIKKILIFSLFRHSDTTIPYIEFAYTILSTSVFIGWGSHLLLDFFSDKGIPLLYPFSKDRMQLYKFCSYHDDNNEQVLARIMCYTTLILMGILIFAVIKFLINFSI